MWRTAHLGTIKKQTKPINQNRKTQQLEAQVHKRRRHFWATKIMQSWGKLMRFQMGYFTSEVWALVSKAPIKPHLQHSYQLLQEIWNQTENELEKKNC